MDFITKLPTSEGYNTILTITDHDCSKAVLLFPCKETITAEEVAKLYAVHVFPHYGIPLKLICDRDMQFTSTFWKELCQKPEIKTNMSITYHPQTDGQSERTNQVVEQYLRIFRNSIQSDWANWLPLAQYTHNSWINETTKQVPFHVLIGITLKAHQLTNNKQGDESRTTRILEIRHTTQQAMTKAQEVITKQRMSNYKPYQIGDQVWLEASNLKTTHSTAKLAPRRYGPFIIINKISDVVYQLELPQQWKIHNTFHAHLLHPYIETESHGPNYPEPPPDIIEGTLEYEVQEVLGS
jgi:hypothetical protein